MSGSGERGSVAPPRPHPPLQGFAFKPCRAGGSGGGLSSKVRGPGPPSKANFPRQRLQLCVAFGARAARTGVRRRAGGTGLGPGPGERRAGGGRAKRRRPRPSALPQAAPPPPPPLHDKNHFARAGGSGELLPDPSGQPSLKPQAHGPPVQKPDLSGFSLQREPPDFEHWGGRRTMGPRASPCCGGAHLRCFRLQTNPPPSCVNSVRITWAPRHQWGSLRVQGGRGRGGMGGPPMGRACR